jgi:hypothetical protein
MFGCEYSNEVDEHHHYQEAFHGFSNLRRKTSEKFSGFHSGVIQESDPLRCHAVHHWVSGCWDFKGMCHLQLQGFMVHRETYLTLIKTSGKKEHMTMWQHITEDKGHAKHNSWQTETWMTLLHILKAAHRQLQLQNNLI